VTDRLSTETFVPALGTAFATHTDAGPLDLTLTAVDTREQHSPDAPAGWQPFTLTFEGPVDPILVQRTYRMDSDVVGSHDVFLVPVGRDDKATRYQAVFG
jgi:hypothetical protein